MIGTDFPSDHPFVFAIFGCQYHASSPSASKTNLINTFQKLISSAGIPVEALEQIDIVDESDSSRTWLSYWPSKTAYQEWWQSEPVQSFWSNLPDDAGFWREALTLHKERTMFESSHSKPNGFSNFGTFAGIDRKKTGFWGAYRSRLDPNDPMQSSMASTPPPRIEAEGIRRGRVKIEAFPDNICCVVEGQDLSFMKGRELSFWLEHLDEVTNEWVTACLEADQHDGMLCARSFHDASSSPVGSTSKRSWATGLTHKRRCQVFYFQDLSMMERIGKKYKLHRDLRKDYLGAYGPGGEMTGGDMVLWVDLSVLKGEDMEAEYVGCYEGTGFMAFDGCEAFKKSGSGGGRAAARL